MQDLYLGASAIVFNSISDPATLEALAVREAMALAEDLQLQAIHVASDCKGVVDDIKQRSVVDHASIIHEIERSHVFTTCNIIHEFRSLNFEAHNLAKYVLTLGFGRHVWLGQPGGLSFVPVNIQGSE